jgi:hypothetical protein
MRIEGVIDFKHDLVRLDTAAAKTPGIRRPRRGHPGVRQERDLLARPGPGEGGQETLAQARPNYAPIRLVHNPAIPDGMSTRAGSLGQQWREPKHPSIHRDVIDLDATLGEQLFDVAVGQPKAQIPADGQHDHVGREAKAGEGSLPDGTKARAASSLMPTVWLRDAVAADATVPRPILRAPRAPLHRGARAACAAGSFGCGRPWLLAPAKRK